jgi:hypothetical protein
LAPFFIIWGHKVPQNGESGYLNRAKRAGMGHQIVTAQEWSGKCEGRSFPVVKRGDFRGPDSKGYAQRAQPLCPKGLAQLSTISVDKAVDWMEATGAKPGGAGFPDKSTKK